MLFWEVLLVMYILASLQGAPLVNIEVDTHVDTATEIKEGQDDPAPKAGIRG
jgi:hypothetical protein